MTDANRCPSCGAERPANSPEGLCPRCLMQQALDTDPPISAGASVLASLAATVGSVPRVLLRDDTATGEPPSPLIQPSSPEMPDLPDRSARLQLFGEIARGGMGAVLRGRDIDLGRDLAVKVLLEAHQEKPELVKRFVEEAQIGGQLQHPGVVPVYELGTLRRPPALLHHEAGERAHAGRAACASGSNPARIGRGSWRSSHRSARRWPMRTPAA